MYYHRYSPHIYPRSEVLWFLSAHVTLVPSTRTARMLDLFGRWS